MRYKKKKRGNKKKETAAVGVMDRKRDFICALFEFDGHEELNNILGEYQHFYSASGAVSENMFLTDLFYHGPHFKVQCQCAICSIIVCYMHCPYHFEYIEVMNEPCPCGGYRTVKNKRIHFSFYRI